MLNIELERSRQSPTNNLLHACGDVCDTVSKQKAHRKSWSQLPDWRSRGYLPHCDEIGLIQHITFRLSDSVPVKKIAEWREELGIIPGLSVLILRANISGNREIRFGIPDG